MFGDQEENLLNGFSSGDDMEDGNGAENFVSQGNMPSECKIGSTKKVGLIGSTLSPASLNSQAKQPANQSIHFKSINQPITTKLEHKENNPATTFNPSPFKGGYKMDPSAFSPSE
jgi:hypothetical protein